MFGLRILLVTVVCTWGASAAPEPLPEGPLVVAYADWNEVGALVYCFVEV